MLPYQTYTIPELLEFNQLKSNTDRAHTENIDASEHLSTMSAQEKYTIDESLHLNNNILPHHNEAKTPTKNANTIYIRFKDEFRIVDDNFNNCMAYVKNWAHRVNCWGTYHHPTTTLNASEAVQLTTTELTEEALASFNVGQPTIAINDDSDTISTGSSDQDSIFSKNDKNDDSDTESEPDEDFDFHSLVNEVDGDDDEMDDRTEAEKEAAALKIVAETTEEGEHIFSTFGTKTFMEVLGYLVTDDLSFWSFEKTRTIIKLLDTEKRIDRAWLSQIMAESFEFDHDVDFGDVNWVDNYV